MIERLRREWEARFSDASYDRQKRSLAESIGAEIAFRTAESPLFIPGSFAQRAGSLAQELLRTAASPALQQEGVQAIPHDFNVACETERPLFGAVDFAIVGSRENPELKLIELQGFPSLFYFQAAFSENMRDAYALSKTLNGMIDPTLGVERYYEILRDAIVAGHDPKEVVLLEIDPFNQKTLPDFLLTARQLGIHIADIEDVEADGRHLYYRDASGKRIQISRIYNRAIHDEIVRRGIRLPFDVGTEYDVEWAGHPNWYFRISKILLPRLGQSFEAVPSSWYLDEADAAALDLENFVLKPLYSFAGAGVTVGPTLADIENIPLDQRHDWLLQERVQYADVFQTPQGDGVKAELRVLLVWPAEAADPIALHTLVRLTRGKMVGVDFNKGLDFVGSSCGLIDPSC